MRYALAVLLFVATTGFRHGANHHLGDDSFVAAFGREPGDADSEAVRMHTHLTYVRELLAKRDATRPALAARRTQMLGYLSDYIAKGTTPTNDYVPYRNPVFIDRNGNVCAVGYLIERSVGREVAETIAAAHRLDYLEDIAAAMPEVAAWIDGSGFTLDELASIQPGYSGPDVMHMGGWLAKGKTSTWQEEMGATMPADGEYVAEGHGVKVAGTLAKQQMTGTWTVKVDGKLRGQGTFVRGEGVWTSLRADGTTLATGPFVKSRPHGRWKFYHPSGRIAAKGRMDTGWRDGSWSFFYDTPGSPKISIGSFAEGEALGTWKHYDMQGVLVATTRGRAWKGLALDIEPGRSGVRRAIHQGFPAENYRMDGLFAGNDKLYVNQDGEMYDGVTAQALVKTETGSWIRRACAWPEKRKAAARSGDVWKLHEMLRRDPDDDCNGRAVKVSKARAKRIEKLLAARMDAHAPIPAFDIDPQPPVVTTDEADDTTSTDPTDAPELHVDGLPDDLATYLTDSMTWYVEFPHVDGSFRAVYATLPGYREPPAPEE